eukprot:Skav204402  [mRNA]  locus=scaffold2947:236057:236764:+ [translate_table: standard]
MSSRALNQVAWGRVIFADHQTLLTMGPVQLLLQANCRKDGEEIQHGFGHGLKSLTPQWALGFEACAQNTASGDDACACECLLCEPTITRYHNTRDLPMKIVGEDSIMNFIAGNHRTVNMCSMCFERALRGAQDAGNEGTQSHKSFSRAWPGISPYSSGFDLALAERGTLPKVKMKRNFPKFSKAPKVKVPQSQGPQVYSDRWEDRLNMTENRGHPTNLDGLFTVPDRDSCLVWIG